MEKRGQVSLFVIIAILIVVLLVVFFVVQRDIFKPGIPRQLEPVFSYFENCAIDKAEQGISLIETQGGYIELPEFEPGNDYMPFSSQLDFYGFGIPYWYYVSGNGVAKKQVPAKADMELQLESYLENEIETCNFNQFSQQGFVINKGEVNVNVRIENENVNLDVDMPLTVSFDEISSSRNSHNLEVDSSLGKFYNTALEIYQKQQNEKFLEQYGLDVLWLYAPMTGVELTCSPKIWNPQDVVFDLLDALEANTQALKVKNSDYELSKKENRYFVLDVKADENVQFLFSREFPSRIEVWPVENDLMIAEPVGAEQGLGVLGFCYVPYHFVYDMVYPVLVQIYDEDEVFQFPTAVVIQKNQATIANTAEIEEPDICDYKNTLVNVYTYDKYLNPAEANIRFKCFDTSCGIGQTVLQGNEAKLTGLFPECSNGFIIAEKEGYKTTKYQISTNREGTANILMMPEYEVEIQLNVDGKNTNNLGMIYFENGNENVVAWPNQKKVELSEGYYNVTVYVFSNTSIILPEQTTQKCVEVSKSGLSGFFGGTIEKCFDVTIPKQEASFALRAGGKSQEYFIESQLEQGRLIINTYGVKTPRTIEDLQETYDIVETQNLNLVFG